MNDKFSAGIDYLSLIREIMNKLKESSCVNDVVQAFQNLQIILHTEEKLFIHIFENVYQEFKKFLMNENPEIVKACLGLLSELFAKKWLIIEIKEWVVYLIPILIRLNALGEGSLDEQSYFLLSTCLENIPRFCQYEETALTLLYVMTDENCDSLQKASQLFKEFIRRCEKCYIMEVFEWNEIFENILWLFNNGNKKAKIGESIINFLYSEIFSPVEWQDIMCKLDYEYLEKIVIIVKFNYSSVYKKKKMIEANSNI